jgi:hypothetical protein
MSVYLFIVCAVASSASSAAQQWPQDAGGRPPDLRKLPPDVRELFDAGVGSLAEQRKHWETVAIDELTSVNPMLLRRLRSLHATAGKVAKPFWDYQPYHVRAWNSTLWTAWWATPAEALVPFGGFRIDPPPKPDEERHIIRIEALVALPNEDSGVRESNTDSGSGLRESNTDLEVRADRFIGTLLSTCPSTCVWANRWPTRDRDSD